MVSLTIDPWDPGYGGSVELDEATESQDRPDTTVETTNWRPIVPTGTPDRGETRCAFVDGVRRIDLRLFAGDGGQDAPALAGSWGVGAAWNSKPPRIDHVIVGRELVVANGLTAEPLLAVVGGTQITYQPSSVRESTPLAAQAGLQTKMRTAEATLAERIFASGETDLLVIDGPLSYYSANGPVLGFIKRQNRSYLDQTQYRIFAELDRAARTPMFGIGEGGNARYSWYMRLAHGHTSHGVLTGIVRVEVSAQVGLEEAKRLANLDATLPHLRVRKLARPPGAAEPLSRGPARRPAPAPPGRRRSHSPWPDHLHHRATSARTRAPSERRQRRQRHRRRTRST
jgi:hypothetical protein